MNKFFGIYHHIDHISFDLYGRKDTFTLADLIEISTDEEYCKKYVKDHPQINRLSTEPKNKEATFDYYYYRPITINPMDAKALRDQKAFDEMSSVFGPLGNPFGKKGDK